MRKEDCMGKFLGSIIIMLVLVQPVMSEHNYDPRNIAVHIFQEYKEYSALDIIKKEEESDEKTDIVFDLSENMDKITKLIKNKDEIVQKVKSVMNGKVASQENMTQEQITEFQQFSNEIQENNGVLTIALNQIYENKDLKKLQQAIMQEDIDYYQVQEELAKIQNAQELAVNTLKSMISAGNRVLEVL